MNGPSVRFNRTAEFLDEIRRILADGSLSRDNIVRLTLLFRLADPYPPMQTVSLRAGFLNWCSNLTELRVRIGEADIWAKPENEVLAKADGLLKSLKEELTNLELDVCAGYFIIPGQE